MGCVLEYECGSCVLTKKKVLSVSPPTKEETSNYVYVYMRKYICVYVYMCIGVQVYMCICVHVYMCICAYVHMCICVCVYMCKNEWVVCLSMNVGLVHESMSGLCDTDGWDALRCRSFLAKEPLIIGLFCRKWPIRIRHFMGLVTHVNGGCHICGCATPLIYKWVTSRMWTNYKCGWVMSLMYLTTYVNESCCGWDVFTYVVHILWLHLFTYSDLTHAHSHIVTWLMHIHI